jgi:hypothetical protein
MLKPSSFGLDGLSTHVSRIDVAEADEATRFVGVPSAAIADDTQPITITSDGSQRIRIQASTFPNLPTPAQPQEATRQLP